LAGWKARQKRALKTIENDRKKLLEKQWENSEKTISLKTVENGGGPENDKNFKKLSRVEKKLKKVKKAWKMSKRGQKGGRRLK